jgi:hypothetical protein
MKRFCISLLFILASGFVKVQAQTATAEIKTKIYCSHCAQCETCGKRFDTELYKLKGLKSFTITGNIIKVSYNPHKITIDQIRQGIAGCGYDADDVKATPAGLSSLDGCCRKNE